MPTTKHWTSKDLDTQRPLAHSFVGLILVFAWVAPLHADPLEPCERMKSQNQLLYQQLKASKSCKESAIGRGWTDCVFKAGRTEILFVGAIGMDPTDRMAGTLGSAFGFVPSTPRITFGRSCTRRWGCSSASTRNRICTRRDVAITKPASHWMRVC